MCLLFYGKSGMMNLPKWKQFFPSGALRFLTTVFFFFSEKYYSNFKCQPSVVFHTKIKYVRYKKNADKV